jgi:hypothetical protein
MTNITPIRPSPAMEDNETKLEAMRHAMMDDMLQIDADIRSMLAKIFLAQNERRMSGTAIDGSWWRRIHDRVGHKRRERVKLQNELVNINRAIRAMLAKEHDRDIEQLFIKVAKQRLPPEVFNDIFREANRMRLETAPNTMTTIGDIDKVIAEFCEGLM